MANCTRCGATMEGLDAGGNMICANCEASMHSSGSGTDVPCQRCGMYLPSHELQMWNSRLYCAYCIMDLKDEERMGREQRKPEAAQQPPPGGLFGRDSSPSQQPPEEKGAGEPMQQYPRAANGICERCGRESNDLYMAQGRRLCQSCLSSGGSSGASPGFFAQIVASMKRAVGIREQPKIIAQQPVSVFDLRTRKMAEKKEVAQPGVKEQGEEKETIVLPQEESGATPAPPSVFDVRERRLVEKKEGMDAEQPISESAAEEKKPKKKAKKLFFKMHPSSGGAVKRK